jgi:hypothetical protein
MRPTRVAITTYAQEAAWGPWQREAASVPFTYIDAVVAAGVYRGSQPAGPGYWFPPTVVGVDDPVPAWRRRRSSARWRP